MIEGGAMAVRGWHMAEPAYAVVAKGANARCGMLYSSMYLHIPVVLIPTQACNVGSGSGGALDRTVVVHGWGEKGWRGCAQGQNECLREAERGRGCKEFRNRWREAERQKRGRER